MSTEIVYQLLKRLCSGLVVLFEDEYPQFGIQFDDEKNTTIEVDGITIKCRGFKDKNQKKLCLLHDLKFQIEEIKTITDFDLTTQSLVVNGAQYHFLTLNKELVKGVAETIESQLDSDFDSVNKKLEKLHQDKNNKYNLSKIQHPKINSSDSLKKKSKDTKGIKNLEKKPENISKEILYNTNFFNEGAVKEYDSKRDYSGFIKTNKSHCVWFNTNFYYRNTDLFWEQLSAYYKSTPYELEQKVNSIFLNKKLPVNELVEIQLDKFPKESSFLDKLREKIEKLKEKNNVLSTHLSELEKDIKEKGGVPEKDENYLECQEQLVKTQQIIDVTQLNLSTHQQKIENLLNKTSDFKLRFYVHALGQHSLLSKYEELIGDKLIDLNTQINEISIGHQKLEQTLGEVLAKLHLARKTKAKYQFLEQSKAVGDFLARQQKTKESVAKEQRKHILNELGQLHENAADVQERINKENKKINHYIENLKTLDNVENYEEQLLKVKQQKQLLEKKKEKFSQYLYKLKLKISVVEESSKTFYAKMCHIVSEFQQEVLDIYSEHKNLLLFSTNALWDEWNNRGLTIINQIFDQKKSVIDAFSEVVLLQIKNIYQHQQKLLLDAQERQKKWKVVYDEVINDFDAMGYCLSIPKTNQLNQKYIELLDVNQLSLSTSTNKVLFYQPNFCASGKGNPLFGLEPKLIDDKCFSVIDQVWNVLTPQQEEQLRIKNLNETRFRDKELLEEKLINLKKELIDTLEAQKYQFKKSNMEESLPESKTADSIQEAGKKYEKELLDTWKDQSWIRSNAIAQFKETVYNFSKKLFSLKSINVVNSEIKFSDTGYIEDDNRTEIFTEKDYFIKSPGMDDFLTSSPQFDVTVDDSDLYDIDDENYLEIINSIDESIEKRMANELKPPVPPSLEEWAQLSVKKYREKKKNYDIDTLNDRMIQLENDIYKIRDVQEKYKEVFNTEITKRNFLYNEIQSDCSQIKQFLASQEHELNSMIDEAKKEIDKNFEEMGKNL